MKRPRVCFYKSRFLPHFYGRDFLKVFVFRLTSALAPPVSFDKILDGDAFLSRIEWYYLDEEGEYDEFISKDFAHHFVLIDCFV